MLDKIKVLLGITDSSKDELLNIIIENDIAYILNRTHRDCFNDNLENILIQCVLWDYNKIGSEGLGSESYSGLSYNYQSQYPENIMSQIRANRKVRVL